MADETLLEWANKQPDWARDALRRHATFGDLEISEIDQIAIRERVRYHSGFTTDPPPACEPLTEGHIVHNAVEPNRQTILCSLGNVENLNRLAPNQRLRFANLGLTLVYGDNGSGKSGYARIAKRLCRSLTSTDLLCNVFEPATGARASVEVRYYRPGDQQVTETTWVDGTFAPTELSNIAVFDSHNARLYVDQENRISYLPKDIALLQRHSESCAKMDAAFQEEIAVVERRIKVPLPTGYSQDGYVAKLLARLDIKSTKPPPQADEIRKAAIFTDDDEAETIKLQRQLAHDPAVLASRWRRAVAALETIKHSIASIGSSLSPEMASRLEALRNDERFKVEVASIAASERFANEPLSDVGLSAWRKLYDYAKAYALTIGTDLDRLPENEGDRCVLCQEPLNKEGATRVRAFNNFVASEATRSADAARRSREETADGISAQSIPTRQQATQLLAEYATLNETRQDCFQTIVSYCEAAHTRRNALVAAITPDDFAALPSLAPDPLSAITADLAVLSSEAGAFEVDARGETDGSIERAKLAELLDRKKLSEDLDTILARRDDVETVIKLRTCCRTVERGHISRQITNLRRSLVMQGLEQRILEEIRALDLTHIPFQISNRSKDGQSYFGVALEASTNVANSKVLSEGEQRALALACFLGEVRSDIRTHGLIVDDPVSSLDQSRLRRVAIRLADEAKTGRQVVIFTHNILFFNEVIDAASRAVPPVPVHKSFIRSSKADGFGIISESEPWVMLPVKDRIKKLQDLLGELATVTDFNTEGWRGKAKDFYSDLRETWERLVEEVLLGKVVERFNTDVRTQSLKGVVVDSPDYKTVYWAVKKASEGSGHDMALGKNTPAPTLLDMRADLKEIEDFRAMIVKRRRDTEEQRKLLEQPPAAQLT